MKKRQSGNYCGIIYFYFLLYNFKPRKRVGKQQSIEIKITSQKLYYNILFTKQTSFSVTKVE